METLNTLILALAITFATWCLVYALIPRPLACKLRIFACIALVVLTLVLATGCTTITYPIKAQGYIVTDTPCPQSPDERLIYRESDNELGCYHTRKLQNNTYIVAKFNGRESWILFYKE